MGIGITNKFNVLSRLVVAFKFSVLFLQNSKAIFIFILDCFAFLIKSLKLAQIRKKIHCEFLCDRSIYKNLSNSVKSKHRFNPIPTAQQTA